MIKVSAIVAVYNEEKYLSRCLDSILNQTLKEIELIIVDDGSTDSTSNICDDYARKYSNVKVVHQLNSGQGLARNRGIDLASGEYLSFIDADDFIDASMYEKLYSFSKNGFVDAIITGSENINEDNDETIITMNVNDGLYCNNELRSSIMFNVISENIGEKRCIGASAAKTLYKNDIIKKNKLRFKSEREYMSEDLIFNIEFYDKASTVYVYDKPLYKCFLKKNSYSRSYDENKFLKAKKLYQFLMDFFKNKSYAEEQKICNNFINNIRLCIIQESKLNSNGFYHQIENIKKICNDKSIIESTRKYSTKNIPFKRKIFAIMLRHRMYIIIYCICKIN